MATGRNGDGMCRSRAAADLQINLTAGGAGRQNRSTGPSRQFIGVYRSSAGQVGHYDGMVTGQRRGLGDSRENAAV